MKYKLYEKMGDFFRSRLFSKINIAIVAVLSITLNIAMGGVAYKEHKEYQALSAVYAGEIGETVSTTAAETTAAVAQITDSEEQTQANVAQESTQSQNEDKVTTAKAPTSDTSAETEQGTYYVTNSGTKYHIGTCSYLSKSRNAITLSEAKAKGYTPCSRCIK